MILESFAEYNHFFLWFMQEKKGCINVLNLVKICLNFIPFKLEREKRKEDKGTTDDHE